MGRIMLSTRPNFEVGKIMRLRKFATPMAFATSIIFLVGVQMRESRPPRKTPARLSSGDLVRVKWGLANTSWANMGHRMVLGRICSRQTIPPRKPQIIVLICFVVALGGGDVSHRCLIHSLAELLCSYGLCSHFR